MDPGADAAAEGKGAVWFRKALLKVSAEKLSLYVLVMTS